MTRKEIEKIKSAILVVLFLVTILLLYLLFGGKDEVRISALIPDFSQTAEDIDVSDFLVPSEIIYGTGDGSYREAKDLKTNFSKYNGLLRKLCGESSVMASEISREQYEAALKEYESVKLSFPYSISFSDYCSLYSIRRSSTFSNIERISCIGFSQAAADSILIEDRVSGKYFRLVPDVVFDMSGDIKPAGIFYDSVFYEAESIIGQGGKNLFPLLSSSNLLSEDFGIVKKDESYRGLAAKAVFGETFDFVRRIADSFGNYTYMYGYGQKTLTLSSDGQLEYKEEPGSGSSKGLYEDLKTAVSFASKLECFDTQEKTAFIITDIIEKGSGKTASYTFVFSQYLDGVEIRNKKAPALELTVENGKLTYLKKNIAEVAVYSISAFVPVIDAANAMAASAGDTEEFAFLAENYKSIKPVLYAENEGVIPCWMLSLNNGRIIFYDLYTGKVME